MPSQDASGGSDSIDFDDLPRHARVWIGGHDFEGKRIAYRRLSAAEQPATGLIDLAVITPQSVDEAVYFADKLRDRLSIGAAVWILIPKHGWGSKLATGEILRNLSEVLAKLGLIEAGTSSIEEQYEIVRFTSTSRETPQ